MAGLAGLATSVAQFAQGDTTTAKSVAAVPALRSAENGTRPQLKAAE